jgi:aminopeptidase N
MENKGLNVFNTAYVLADPKTATDGDYERVEGVIGHEYFHNWTGNRVTCRDWFQLTLKEVRFCFLQQHADTCVKQLTNSLSMRWQQGLTVFR